ncbi:MAG: 50S ribosome-binding GTPase [candidate division WOR-3 bacterium]|nr:50S ribosome-binding GTPase [candidate division WOR-3 bacterium]
MPANLTPEYLEADKRFKQAKTIDEKIACLQEMMAVIPKHKGTEKMRADLKRRLSNLLKQKGEKSHIHRAVWYHFEKQGAGQVAVFGTANVGKSSLVKVLTGAPTEVASYPFTTKVPQAGMLLYEDVQIQLIDTPPLTNDSPGWLFHILRTADTMLWVIDVSADDLLESVELCLKKLREARLYPTEESPEAGRNKKLLAVANKCDEPNSKIGLELLKEFLNNSLHIIEVSVLKLSGLEELKIKIFESLEIIRVYTKPQGKPPDLTEPVILKKGSTVLDAARALHKEFAEKLKFARLWDNKAFFGQRVEKTYILKDKDIVEFHV